MATKALFIIACYFFVASALNEKPIIGVYRHPSNSNHPQCGGKCEVLEASYVKWVESAGGRVVPIPANADNATVARLFAAVNGILLPGGGTDILPSFKRFYALAVAANQQGDYFPVWGTCLGFEWLVQAQSADDSILDTGFDSENISLPLNFSDSATTSRMFQKNSQMLQIFQGEPITMNNHNAGIEPSHFTRTKLLADFFNVLSTNVDRKGRAFVSAIEGKTLPIYGVQFHPEKNNFELGENSDGSPYEAINHSADAVLGSQFLANFFINEARRSAHRFDTPADEAKALIYNYQPTFTGPEFLQTYFFRT